MNEKGYPWDSNGEDKREYGAQHLANAFKRIVRNGIVHEYDFPYTILSGGILRIGAGEAWINGHTVSVIGYEDVDIPYSATQSSAGILVLTCDESVDIRGFKLEYKTPNDPASTPAIKDNELLLYEIDYSRDNKELSENNVRRAKVSISYPIETGIKRSSQDGWIVERFYDGYVRAFTTRRYKEDGGFVTFKRLGNSPVFVADLSPQRIDCPIKFENPVRLFYSADGSCLGDCSIVRDAKNDEFKYLMVDGFYYIYRFDDLDTEISTGHVSIHIALEGYEKT